ncbi:hypothetical protein K474DRAFT_1680497 [Panus rudis PR-1116 ss-1]|nr:hypothetical protein K474DRAFT_1680497 [Panus rudis PR-1116 ss-1]
MTDSKSDISRIDASPHFVVGSFTAHLKYQVALRYYSGSDDITLEIMLHASYNPGQGSVEFAFDRHRSHAQINLAKVVPPPYEAAESACVRMSRNWQDITQEAERNKGMMRRNSPLELGCASIHSCLIAIADLFERPAPLEFLNALPTCNMASQPRRLTWHPLPQELIA